jgi:flagellar basal-body rod modification protein FlgD
MFIKLLAAELQSQDPTQAMDPTQMVGQMFQMNQLQQLIDINQTLSNALGTAPSGGHSSVAAVSSNTAAAPLYGLALPINAADSYAENLLTGAH